MSRSRFNCEKLIMEFILGLAQFGIDGYLGITLFGFATVGFAKIVAKILQTKEPAPKYSRILTFLSLGGLTFIFLKILKFDFLYNVPGFIIAFIINITLYVIVRHIKKQKADYENL